MIEYHWTKNVHRKTTIDALSLFLKDLREYYPNVTNWLQNKVNEDVPGVTRHICIVTNDDIVIGTVIVSNKINSSKISTLYVEESYREKNIGTNLLSMALCRCKMDPTITIPEPIISDYKTLIETFRFKLLDTVPDKYKAGVVEHIYKIPLAANIVERY